MATRDNVSRLLQELRGFAEVTNRRPLAGVSHALWSPARPPLAPPLLPRRKLFISAPEPGTHARTVPIHFR